MIGTVGNKCFLILFNLYVLWVGCTNGRLLSKAELHRKEGKKCYLCSSDPNWVVKDFTREAEPSWSRARQWPSTAMSFRIIPEISKQSLFCSDSISSLSPLINLLMLN
jgi:hypothetical protein